MEVFETIPLINATCSMTHWTVRSHPNTVMNKQKPVHNTTQKDETCVGYCIIGLYSKFR